MNDLKDFLTGQYRAELDAFRASLDSVPEDRFTQAVSGHSPAWHALHVAEWLRLAVLDDRSTSYGHLGWEAHARVQALGGPTPLHESAGKAAVLAALDSVAEQVMAFLESLDEGRLEGTSFSPSAPGGERPRLQGIGLQLRHIAYHRGQVRLGLKDLP